MGGSTVRERQVPNGMDWVVRMGRQCIEAERSRSLGTRSLEEVEHWIKRFGEFAQTHMLATPQDGTFSIRTGRKELLALCRYRQCRRLYRQPQNGR